MKNTVLMPAAATAPVRTESLAMKPVFHKLSHRKGQSGVAQ